MRLLRFFRWLFWGVLWAITITGFHHLNHWPIFISLVLLIALPLISWRFKNEKVLAIGAVVGFLGLLAGLCSLNPSNERAWAQEHSVLAKINISGQHVTIDGLRNFHWKNQKECKPVWERQTFNLDKLKSLELIIEPFKDSDFMAHTMLRFGFSDHKHIVVSVEARREQTETYSLIKGFFHQFELIYIFGQADDLLTLRAVHRNARLYAYPIKADREFMVNLFKDLVASANDLHHNPRFYRSIRENCTTTLVKHFDRQPIEHIGLRRETLFPALTSWLLYQRGFMDTDLSYEQAKKHFRIDEHIREFSRNSL